MRCRCNLRHGRTPIVGLSPLFHHLPRWNSSSTRQHPRDQPRLYLKLWERGDSYWQANEGQGGSVAGVQDVLEQWPYVTLCGVHNTTFQKWH